MAEPGVTKCVFRSCQENTMDRQLKWTRAGKKDFFPSNIQVDSGAQRSNLALPGFSQRYQTSGNINGYYFPVNEL